MNLDWMTKFRPQVMALIIIGGLIALYALRLGHTEVTTAVVGFLGGMSTNLLESDNHS